MPPRRSAMWAAVGTVLREIRQGGRAALADDATVQVRWAVDDARQGNPLTLRRLLRSAHAGEERVSILIALAEAAEHDEAVRRLFRAGTSDSVRLSRWIRTELGSSDADRRAAAVELLGALRPPRLPGTRRAGERRRGCRGPGHRLPCAPA